MSQEKYRKMTSNNKHIVEEKKHQIILLENNNNNNNKDQINQHLYCQTCNEIKLVID